MSRFVWTAAVIGSLIAVTWFAYFGAPLETEIHEVESPLEASGGRVQLVTDEQDVGVVHQGTLLAVLFSVANVGSQTLTIRQSSTDEPGGTRNFRPIKIESGRTSEVTAELWSDELLDRGRKHILFETSDPECSELWLTVRGTMLRRAAGDDFEVERSVLVK